MSFTALMDVGTGKAVTISKQALLKTGFGQVLLSIRTRDGFRMELDYEQMPGDFTVAQMERDFASLLQRAAEATLVIHSPFSSEFYRYYPEDQNWYLTRRGRGFA